MKPVAILQHEASQGPGVLPDHLQQQGLTWKLISPSIERSAPVHARNYSGIVVLGSNHCANEALPWIEDERCLLQSALYGDVPVLGHCFGAQMLARAMGARVWRNPCPNIGWSKVWITLQAQQLMQLPPEACIFHWPCDTFALPEGATRTMYGPHCLNKGFVRGRHWAFQGHLEVTAQSVRDGCQRGHDALRHASGPAVQTEAQILAQLPARMAPLHAMAHRTYSAWTDRLQRPALFRLGALADAGPPAASAPDAALRYQAALAARTHAILEKAAAHDGAGHGRYTEFRNSLIHSSSSACT